MSPKPVALVSMPTLSARFPSFQLALLQPALEREGIEVKPFSLFLYFGAHVGWELNETISNVYPSMVGEWVWSKATFGDFADPRGYRSLYREELEEICALAGCTFADLLRVREELTFSFLDRMLEAVDWSRFELIGFSVCFQQMLASLAMARWLKKKHPDIPIVFGGATFEDDIAHEVLRGSPQVDFVHCGDAESSFPELVKRLREGRPLSGLPGLMRREGGQLSYAGRSPNLEDLDQTPVPDFDEYFYARERSGYERHPGAKEVLLPIETARGCWYGMKNHCTFCGLNRAGLQFRAKSPEKVLEMLKALSRRYGALHFNAIDNILAPEYAGELFGRLAEAHTDLRLHYEIRPNTSRALLKKMKLGGLVSVQPGVESFSTHVLSLMRKHTTALRNLELVKWTTYYGIENYYNVLVGFSGETAEDYRAQAELMRKLFHLQPPYAIARARPDRGSPMFEQPKEHGIRVLRPSPCYAHLYPKDRFNLSQVSYFFEHEVEDTPTAEQYQECFEVVAEWQRRWKGAPPFLRYRKSWETISLEDGRGDTPHLWRYDDREAELYELCADGKRREDLADHFKGDAHWLEGALRDFLAKDLMVFLDGRYLALALPVNPSF
ncbi:MAG: RiPP maturation radical SAM protein 1 [Myxococcales bacterium]|nr:RiPP maturation radical SAM protein 1 [Myxococcales bacterium]